MTRVTNSVVQSQKPVSLKIIIFQKKQKTLHERLLMAALHCEVCSRWSVYRIGSDSPHRRRRTVLWWRSEVEHANLRVHISGNTKPNFTKFSVYVTYGGGLVLLWWRCNMLCISSLVDDVTFSHNRTYGAGDESRVYAQNDSAEGSTDFMSQRILKLTYQGAAWNRGGV